MFLIVFSVILYGLYSSFLEFLLPQAIKEHLIKGVLSVVWLNVGYIVNLLVNNIFWYKLTANEITKEPPRLLVQLSSFFLFIVVCSGLLHNVYGYPVNTLLAASGALGLVLGFALKNLILDTFSGLAINLEKPFRIGDWINCHTRMGNYIGQVVETNWRTTRLKTSSNNVVVIPNSYLTNTLLTNFSMPNPSSRFDQIVVIDFAEDTKKILRIIDAALEEAVINNVLLVSPKPPKVKVYRITETGVSYKIKYFINPVETSPSKANDLCLQYVLNHLKQAGIFPAYPKQDVFNADIPIKQLGWEANKDMVPLLEKLSLFKMLHKEDLELLARNIKIKTIEAQEAIVKEQEDGDSMYIVIEGLFEVWVTNADEEVKVGFISPGSFFGEKSLLTGEKRSATIRAKRESVVGEISKEAMKELFEANQKVVDILSSALAQRELNNQSTLKNINSSDNKEGELDEKINSFVKKIKNFFF